MTTRRGTATVGGWIERSVPALAGALASWLAWRWLPLPAGDPLRAVLVWVPVVVGALAAVERTPGARRLPRRGTRVELVALTALVVVALTRGDLGVRYSDPLATGALVAGLAGLLGVRAARQLLALRPLLGRRLTARPPWAVFWLHLVVYLAILPWSHQQRPPDGDEPYYLLLAHSLAWDGDVDLTDEYAEESYRAFVDRPLAPQPGDPTGARGEIHSRHNALLPLVLAPAYRLLGAPGALATMCVLASLLVWSTLRLARHYVGDRPGEALVACGILGLAPPLLLFSHQAWAEVPAALLLAIGLDAALRLDDHGDPPWKAWTRFVVPLLLLPLLKLRFLALTGALLLLVLFRAPARRRRTVLAVTGGLVLFVAALLLANFVLYGNPLKYYRLTVLTTYLHAPTTYLRGLTGLFFDCAFGLFFAAPVWALLLPALGHVAGRSRILAGHALLLGAPYLLALAPRGEWFGAWSPPFRYGVALLPLLTLLLVPLLADRRRRGARWTLAALILATLVASAVAVATPGWTYNLADGRNHLVDRLSALFEADLARLVPSYLRLRLASWVWPPALALGLLLLWRLPSGTRRAPWTHVCAMLVAAGGATLWLGTALPTRVVELEDPWLTHHGGQLHPDRWRVGRIRFRGAWIFEADTVVTVPVTPGGTRVRVSATVRSPEPGQPSRPLRLLAGSVELGVIPAVTDDRWRRLDLGATAWPPGVRELRVSVTEEEPSAPSRPALLDRLDLEWSD